MTECTTGLTNTYSKANYKALLALAQGFGYQFTSFTKKPFAKHRLIFLRHDVDYSLELALEIAQINASLGIAGTFFLLLRSQVYNLLSPWSRSAVRKMIGLGQRIALHCSVPDELQEKDNLDAFVLADFNRVADEFPEIEPVFAWHNPTPRLLERSHDFHVPGLINVYSKQFSNEEMKYLSDSNMKRTPEDFSNLIKQDHYCLHLLFHPVYWVLEQPSMLQAIAASWECVIRERESEIGLNQVYKQVFPQGMPVRLLRDFQGSWLAAAQQEDVNG